MSKSDRAILKLLLEVFNKPCSIIEAGSNSGHLSYILGKLNYDVTLLDILKKPIEDAKARFKAGGVKASFVCDDIRNIKGRWDGVWNSGVIQCYPLEERVSILERLCQIGDCVLLIFPQFNHPQFPKDFDLNLPPGISNCLQYPVADILPILSNHFIEIHHGILSERALGMDYPMEYVWAKNRR